MAGISQIYADGFARDLIPRSTAPTFLSSTSYAVGDYVYYQGNLYRCTTAHTGTWVASHFTAVTVGSELKAKEASLQSEIDDVKTDLSYLQISVANNFSTTTLYTKGEYCYYDGSLYVCTVDRHRGAWDGTHFQYTKVGAELWYTNKTLTEEIEALEEDIAENYAKQDGYYDEMAVGSAEQLISTVTVEDKVPYQFRTSGGSADIGNRETDKIVGGTVAWNQRCPTQYKSPKNTATTDTRSYIQLVFRKNSSPYTNILSGTINATGMFASVGKSTFDGQAGVIHNGSANNLTLMGSITVYTNHVYLYSVKVNGCDPTTLSGVDLDNQQVFDLTQMFGSTIADYILSLETATAGAGVAFFRKLFSKPYYAYDAGTLKHVEGLASHDMTGFNQWDVSKDNIGKNLSATGELQDNQSYNTSDYIRVVPNATYYFKNVSPNTEARSMAVYDLDKNFIEIHVFTGSNHIASGTYTIPDNGHYVRVVRYATVTDVCINLSWDGERNGEYEAYVKHSYPLDDSIVLRGIPKLDSNNQLYYDGDEYASDGTVTRKYGIVDLGTLIFTKRTEWSDRNVYEVQFANGKRGSMPMVCSKYVWFDGLRASAPDKTCFKGNLADSATLMIRDDSITSESAFRTAMSGVYLVYELVTPTEETAEPYTGLQIVDSWGTEEYVSSSIVPTGHVTQYPIDLKAKVEASPNAPSDNGDYIVRHANGENTYVPLIIPTELPTAPSNNGTYTLKVTVSDGTATYSWVSD